MRVAELNGIFGQAFSMKQDELSREQFQPAFHQVVIVAAACVDGDRAAFVPALQGAGIVLRPVVHAHHYDGAHVRPEHAGVGATLGRIGHPVHAAVAPRREPVGEPRRQLRHGIRPRHAHHVEAQGAGVRDEAMLQKSRSA